MDFDSTAEATSSTDPVDDFDEGPDNIWIASSNGDITRVQQLLTDGISVNCQDDAGYSPMHAAVSYGHMELIKILLSAGAVVDIEDLDGDTPLLVCEDPEVFELLIKSGADIKKVNHIGWGIFEKVIDDDNETMMKYLIEHGLTDNPELIAQMMSNIDVGTIPEGDEDEDDNDDEDDDITDKDNLKRA